MATEAEKIEDGGAEFPELLRLWKAPWSVTSDGIQSADGCWIMSATNPLLAERLVEMANYAARKDDAPDLLEALKLLLSDVKDYEAWKRPCHAVDVAESAVAKAEGRS